MVQESRDACATSLLLFFSFLVREVKWRRHRDREEGVAATKECRSRRTENTFFSCYTRVHESSRSSYIFLFGHSSL